jgi:transcription-repair coupling factor (superfamily II helicase)
LFETQNQEKNSGGAPPVESLLRAVRESRATITCSGGGASDQAYLTSRIHQAAIRPMLVVTATDKAAEKFISDLELFEGGQDSCCLYFPSYNILASQALSYHNEIAAQRIATLYRLATGEAPLVVTPISALMQKLLPKEELVDFAELLMKGEALERDRLVGKLNTGGYTRSMIVEEPGDFGVRGGILDVFSPLYPDPLRIEFFGDTVDSIRFFSASTQRTLKEIPEAILLPAREIVLKKDHLDQVFHRIRQQAAEQNLPVTQIRALLERIKTEGVFTGIESLAPMIHPVMGTLFDYTSESTLFILLEPDALQFTAENMTQRAASHYQSACEEPRLCARPEELYLSWQSLETVFREKGILSLQALPLAASLPEAPCLSMPVTEFRFTIEDNSTLRLALKAFRTREHLFEPLADWIHAQQAADRDTVLVCRSRSQAERLCALLRPYGFDPERHDQLPDPAHRKGHLIVCIGRLSAGFVWPALQLAIITEEEIFGAGYQRRKPVKVSARAQLLELADLKQSDLVVHQEHGIGQYQGLAKLTLNGSTNDFMLITYKDDDKLYLPVDRMNLIQKYMGVESILPVLDKLGGKSWERVRAKVKQSTEKIAGELLKLYAARKVAEGTAFTAIDRSFQEFETAFPFEETADQMKAIDDVLADMGRTQPMDRLVCGDVGYGKTEVALRAAFLAANSGKQVAVLVPTTVLAEQHFKTFKERFERYPFFVECLSRFRSAKEQRNIVADLKAGKIDIIIGTHRLLSKDVIFKDIGLVILDEEQRFGVTHKEKLKKLRHSVDVLALTATPIPRTLHLSMVGVRDISIISTPPEQRHPIISYICEFEDITVTEAIRKELDRKGQIFFVHNNISSIAAMANRLQKLVPEVRLGIAHGRMPEAELEKVMLKYLNRDIDLLVCTTIIESGLDISSANTILINRADRFGLSQIYQLRGRVGRSDEQAYAYLFIPRDSVMSTDAQKRLKVLMEHSDLGSGFQIAMNDLKIRGGGTILGASQSGHIAAVGYDMFLQLMENSINELKGEPVMEALEPEINISLSAFLPETYIPNIDQRLTVYRRLSKLTELKEISDFKAELQDRFGTLPEEAANLLLKIMLRVLAIKAGIRRMDLTGRQLMLHFSETHQKQPFGLVDMVTENPEQFRFTPDQGLRVTLHPNGSTGLLAQTKNILKEIMQHVNA